MAAEKENGEESVDTIAADSGEDKAVNTKTDSTAPSKPSPTKEVDTKGAEGETSENDEDVDDENTENPQFRTVDKEDRKLFQEVQTLVQKVILI